MVNCMLFFIIFIIGYPCHRSVGPAGDSVNPHPNTPATEAGPRYWGGYLSRLDRIQWSAFVLVLTSTVAHIPLRRESQGLKPHSCITIRRISLFPGNLPRHTHIVLHFFCFSAHIVLMVRISTGPFSLFSACLAGV